MKGLLISLGIIAVVLFLSMAIYRWIKEAPTVDDDGKQIDD